MTTDRAKLMSLLEAFVYHDQRSVGAVGRIEDAILYELDQPGLGNDRELLDELLDLVSRYVEHPAQDETELYGPDMLDKYFRWALQVLGERGR